MPGILSLIGVGREGACGSQPKGARDTFVGLQAQRGIAPERVAPDYGAKASKCSSHKDSPASGYSLCCTSCVCTNLPTQRAAAPLTFSGVVAAPGVLW